MGFLDFLRPKKNGHVKPLDAQRADIDAALERIAKEREDARSVLDGLDQRRECLILADAPEHEIMVLDAEGDRARIKLEKLDVFESEVHARLSEVAGIEAELEWRKLFEERHEAACDFALAFNPALGARSALLAATNQASASEIARRFGLLTEPAPLILSGESLQKFLQETEMMSDREARRRAAVERRQEVQG